MDGRLAASRTRHHDAETADSSWVDAGISAADRCPSNPRNPNLPRFVTVSRRTLMIMSQRPSHKQEFLSAGFPPVGPQGPKPPYELAVNSGLCEYRMVDANGASCCA